MKELREVLVELEWYIFLSCFTLVLSVLSRLVFCCAIWRRRVLTRWVRRRVLDFGRLSGPMMQKS